MGGHKVKNWGELNWAPAGGVKEFSEQLHAPQFLSSSVCIVVLCGKYLCNLWIIGDVIHALVS